MPGRAAWATWTSEPSPFPPDRAPWRKLRPSCFCAPLEIVDDRHECASTIVTSTTSSATRHWPTPSPTASSSVHRLVLKGEANGLPVCWARFSSRLLHRYSC